MNSLFERPTGTSRCSGRAYFTIKLRHGFHFGADSEPIAQLNLRSRARGCYNESLDEQGAKSREGLRLGHREARMPISCRGFRVVAIGLFFLLVDRLRRRRLPIAVARQSSQGLVGFFAAGTSG
jgi:hypothetical protein